MYCRLIAVACAAAFLALLAPPVQGQGYYGGVIDNRASTPAESYSRGMADVVRSSGAANLMNSEAAQGYEEARSMEMDNQVKYAETYYEKREIHDQYQDKHRQETQEYLYRRAQKQTEVPRLSPAELDPVTGQLTWPPVLHDSPFDPYREELDKKFSQREISLGAIGWSGYNEIRESINSMASLLKERIRQYPSADYVDARDFLTRLENEAKHAIE